MRLAGSRPLNRLGPDLKRGAGETVVATPVGEYAAALTGDLRGMPRVTITGELSDVRSPSKVQHYFQLRDERGGVPCTMWRTDFDKLDLPPETLKDGAMVVATGGPDYYPGGKTASPSFSFRVTKLRPSGEGDLHARLAALRRQFDSEGLLLKQKALARARLPKRIGVITAETGAARQDLMAGLQRRGWSGEVVWGFAPVQDRKAAPLIRKAVSDMAAMAEVEVIVLCRGGGSLTDLWAFCDEDLCRTVAMLAVPVVSAVGHERDTTLLDDVAAVRCSTPTHAAEAAVPLDCRRARADISAAAAVLERAGRLAVAGRIAPLVRLAKGPERALRIQRAALNQKARETRASADRGMALRRVKLAAETTGRVKVSASHLGRTIDRAMVRTSELAQRLPEKSLRLLKGDLARIERHSVALRAHDPQRTLERGYARVEDSQAEPVLSGAAAKRAGDLAIHFADGVVKVSTESPTSRKKKRKTPASQPDFQQTSFKGVGEDE